MDSPRIQSDTATSTAVDIQTPNASSTSMSKRPARHKARNRRVVLIGAALAASITGAIYMWSVFSTALSQEQGWTLSSVTLAYSLMLGVEGFSSIASGFLQRRFSSRGLLFCGGMLLSAGWFLTSFAQEIWQLYLAFGLIGGLGSGAVYNVAISLVAKWFPDKRGTANGICVALVGVTPFIFAPLSNFLISSLSISASLQVCGLIFASVFVAVLFLVDDPAQNRPTTVGQSEASSRAETSGRAEASGRSEAASKPDTGGQSATGGRPKAPSQPLAGRFEMTTGEVVKSPLFYVIWLLFMLCVCAGAMIISVSSDVGQKMAGLDAAQAAAIVGLIPLASTAGRFGVGAISDRIGRYPTIIISLICTAVAMLALFPLAKGAILFTMAAFVLGFFYGGFMAVFPSLCGDAFGNLNFGSNYALLFTAITAASFIGPMAASLTVEATGSYTLAYVIAGTGSLAGIVVALFAQRLDRRRG